MHYHLLRSSSLSPVRSRRPAALHGPPPPMSHVTRRMDHVTCRVTLVAADCCAGAWFGGATGHGLAAALAGRTDPVCLQVTFDLTEGFVVASPSLFHAGLAVCTARQGAVVRRLQVYVAFNREYGRPLSWRRGTVRLTAAHGSRSARAGTSY